MEDIYIYIYIYIYRSFVWEEGRYADIRLPFPYSLCHGGCSQPGFDPKGCSTVSRVVEPPPSLTQSLGVGTSGGQPPGSPGGGGGVSGDPNIPQSDPHDALIVLNVHKWGKNCFQKKLPINSGPHQPRSDPEVGSGSKSFFVLFIQRHHSSGSDCASAPELHRPPL